MKSIILLSGGLDSAVALASTIEEGRQDLNSRQYALTFWYGQRHTKEIDSAKKIARHYGVDIKTLSITSPPGRSALTSISEDLNREYRGLPASFVPARNLIFLSYAASMAYSLKVDTIVGGWNSIDYPGYPDCRPEFLRDAEIVINSALGMRNMQVVAPLIELNKKEIIQKGRDLQVPFELTWSCYEGGEKPCRKCSSCLFREKGFEEAGIKDPLLGGD